MRLFQAVNDKTWTGINAGNVLKKLITQLSCMKAKAASASQGIQDSYDAGVNDEFVEPFIVIDDQKACINEDDEVVFFNFRPDRARQITRAFVDKDFSFFPRPFVLSSEAFVCMTQYDETIDAQVAYPPTPLKNTLGEVLSKAGLHQLRIAETEKYAHVTFFLMVEKKYLIHWRIGYLSLRLRLLHMTCSRK